MRFGRPQGVVLAVLVFLGALSWVRGWKRYESSQPRPIVVSCGAVGLERELCQQAVDAWSRKTGRAARVVAAPADSGERFGLYQLLLAAGSNDIDVFLIDATWPGLIGDFFVDLSDRIPKERLRDLFPTFLKNNTVGGKLTAMPWFMDAGLLFFRKDLLKRYGERPPQTWDELTRMARRIQEGERAAGNTRFWGWVFQGKAYEGLTCNVLEWIASSGGGSFVDSAGEVTIQNPDSERALRLASSWVGWISPPGVLNYTEEEVRGAFQSGNALFMRNWPYAWKLAQDKTSEVRGRVGVSALPSGGAGHAATLGGWSLAVSRVSHDPQAAVDLVNALTSPAEQKRRALAAGLNPTLRSLYSDPEFLESNPLSEELLRIFEHTVARPSRVTRTRYNRVSMEIRDRVHSMLEDRVSPTQLHSQLVELQQALERIRGGGQW